MVAVCLDDPAFVPLLDDGMLVEHLVWSASSRLVTDVWVAGVQVVVATGGHRPSTSSGPAHEVGSAGGQAGLGRG